MKIRIAFLLLGLTLMPFSPGEGFAYPIDGYEKTQIRRLLRLQLILKGEIKESPPLPGAQKSIADIHLNLLGERGENLEALPAPDPELQKALNTLFPVLHESYSITLLDITPGRPIRLAQRQPERGFQPGSVGKLAIALGLFTELAKIYPDSFELRQDLLCTKMIKAGKVALSNEHTVPFYDPDTRKFAKRILVAQDIFSLYEWVDHALSVSSNGAASVLWREVVLMRAFGQQYPGLSQEGADEYFKVTPKATLREIAMDVVNGPMRSLGISESEWRLGSFFTAGGKAMIPGEGGSTGTPTGLMKFLVAMERGKIVDAKSSLEIKRLMYMTDKRIRYASAPVFNEAAVYFKSGSLYKCKEEPGYSCGKYRGNVDNYMNSVVIVEHKDGRTYMVTLMSNVLRKNSGTDHAYLAGKIDKIIEKPM